MNATIVREVMDCGFALFNSHLNDAQSRADKAFVKRYGQKAFVNEIAPFHKAGIMGIFNQPPNEWTQYYVDLVHAFVNEERELAETKTLNAIYDEKAGK